MRIPSIRGVSRGARWALAAIGMGCLLVLVGLVVYRDDVTIMEVRAVDDGIALEAILSTCNANVTVEVDEYHDRIVLRAKNHDRRWPFAGGDDCQDLVRVDLEYALGAREVIDSSGTALIRNGSEQSAPPPSPPPTESTAEPGATRTVTLAELEVPAGRILHQCGVTRWCVTEADGSESTPLGGLPAATLLAPSPDGAFIAYFEHQANQRWLGIARADGSEPRRLIEARPVHDPVPPVWSPDGETIYVEQGPPPGTDGIGGDTDILAVSVATGEARLLVDTDWFDGGPQVSPDGSMVAYMHENPAAGGGSSIGVVAADGGAPLDLTGDPTINLSPAWLGNDRIVFVGWREGNAGSYNLYTISADGSDLSASLLVDHPAADIVFPVGHFPLSVSPNDEWVAFQSDRSGTLELYITRADGSEVRQITMDADGSAGIQTWSPDSAFLAYAATMGGGQGVWISRVHDGATAYLGPGASPVWLP